MRSWVVRGEMLRVWLRGTRRRPVRAAVVVAGVALMGTAISAALVGGDLLEGLFVADAEAEWGAVDLEARADGNAVHDLSTGRLLGVEGPPQVAAAAPRLLLRGAAQADGAGIPDVQVMGLGAEEAGFPPFDLVDDDRDGLDVLLGLGPDEVLVNQRLAERLGVRPGSDIEVVVAVPRWLEDVAQQTDPLVHRPTTVLLDVEIAGIAADAGTPDLHRTANVLLRRDVLARATGLDGRVTATHLRLTDRDRETARRTIDGLAHLVTVFELDVDPVRVEQLTLADEEGGLFRSILLTMGALVALAAALAIRGLLVALAEERGRELATLRALGLRARRVAQLVTIEGGVLGVAGAVAGGLLGLPVGQAITSLLADHFAALSSGRGREQVALTPELSATPVLIGAAITVVVVVAAARSGGRLVATASVSEGLRGSPLAPRPQSSGIRRRLLGVAVGGALLGAGATAGGALVFLGVTVLLSQWWLHRRRDAAEQPTGTDEGAGIASVDRRAALVGLAWSLVGAALLTDPAAGVEAGMGVLVVAGLVAIGCGTVLLLPHLRTAGRLLRAYLPRGGAQVAVGTAAAVAERDRRRSTVTTATVGAVLFMVAALSVLGSTQALPLPRQSGGFDVLVRSVAGLDRGALRGVPGVAAAVTVSSSTIPQTSYSVGPEDGPRLEARYPVRMLGATRRLAAMQDFGLAAAVDGIMSSTQALDLVARERGAAVVDRGALPEGARVGDHVVIDAGASPRRLRLVAVLDTYLLRAVVANEGDMAQLTQLRSPNLALVTGEAGSDPQTLAARIPRQGGPPGTTAETMAEIRHDVVAANRTFTDTFTVMLLLAVVVSTGSVAAHVVRVARERRAELAVLRAVGVRRRGVALLLSAEPLLGALLGAVLGVGVGLGLLRLLFWLGFSDLAFVVRWTHLGVVAAGTLALLALACGMAAAVGVPRDLDTALRDLG